MQEKLLSMLGLARRAGKLSLGHDAAISGIKAKKAKLCVCSLDASSRLQREAEQACLHFGGTAYLKINYDSMKIGQAIGKKVSIFTVDDDGFASIITKLAKED